jgi:putative hydrolase of the HAD superfamily
MVGYTVRREGCPLGAVETWVFDLDNTLYPASSGLFPLVQERMNAYICRLLGVTLDEAKVLRAQYFREHGTTMHGLMAVHRIDPHEFMAFVHDVDLACVPANPALVQALQALSGRKLIYTNGSVPHAENLLRHLGISHHFDDIFDIVASDFAPKPAMAALRLFIDRFGVKPAGALMVEDMAKNLAPAAELGMTTAWVKTDVDWAAIASGADHINYVVDDLAAFLAAAADLECEGRR